MLLNLFYQGEIDAGATYNEALDAVKQSGVDISELIMLEKLKTFLKMHWRQNENVSDELIIKLKQEFINYKGIEGIESPVEGFVESNDEKYNVIRKVWN